MLYVSDCKCNAAAVGTCVHFGSHVAGSCRAVAATRSASKQHCTLTDSDSRLLPLARQACTALSCTTCACQPRLGASAVRCARIEPHRQLSGGQRSDAHCAHRSCTLRCCKPARARQEPGITSCVLAPRLQRASQPACCLLLAACQPAAVAAAPSRCLLLRALS